MFNYLIRIIMKWIILCVLIVFTLFCFYKARSRRCKCYKSYEEYLKALNYEERYRWRATAITLMLVDVIIFFFYII